MSEQQHYLHFTLGPVQGFVSQARRTRDFWAGSFLLSWLTAHAIKAVQAAGGTIVMPAVDGDALLNRVQASSGSGPNIGSLPNNFIAQVNQGFDGDIATQAVQQAWKALADAVWVHDKLERAGVNCDLWNTQIQGFWDTAWVVADSDDAKVLAMRKNWRSYMPPESVGDKCTMMGEWQELSGAEKPQPNKQQAFWQGVKQNARISDIELRDNERLCAIAYVKRRFVHVWEALEGHTGWKLPTSVPSTSYMAAVHWLEQLIQAKPGEAEVKAFVESARLGEKLTRIQCISEAMKDVPDYVKGLADVDGRALFKSDKQDENDTHRKAMLKTVPSFKVPLSPFYAILMMDGDSLGETKKRLAAAGKSATSLSEALASFTRAVPHIVEEHHGFLIYAGGDDVLAILPLEDALPCAAACRVAYQEVFGDQKASISAAIEYAHMKLPLTMILKDAHQLLDDVAKDKTGRDAVACRVWKSGGEQQTWAMPWDHALDGDTLIIAALAENLGEDKQGEPGYANKLLYHIRDTLEMLQGASDIEHEDMVKLLVADYISSGLLDKIKEKNKKVAQATSLIEPLLKQCKVFEHQNDTGKLSADAALLLRFLAQKGVER